MYLNWILQRYLFLPFDKKESNIIATFVPMIMQTKRRSYIYRCLSAIFIVALICSCSTVKVIPEGESMLRNNNIKLLNRSRVRTGDISALLRQQPNSSVVLGWKPSVVIYNWTKGRFGQAPVVFDSTLVYRSKENINNYLISRGYYNSTIKDTIITSGKKTTVRYSVLPGNFFRIDTVIYNIADTAIARVIAKDAPNSTLRKGSVLSENRLESEGVRLSSILRNNGYYNFSKNFFFFEADTSSGSGSAQLYITVNNYVRSGSENDTRAHQQYRVRNISIYPDYDPMREVDADITNIHRNDNISIYESDHGKSVRPGVIDRLNLIKPGELYSEKTANDTYNRFVALRYYSGVNLQFDEVFENDSDSLGKVDLTIRLTPSKSQGFKLNLEASTNSSGLFGISPNVSYFHKNIFRGGEWFTLGFMGNFQFKFREPARSTEFGVSAGISFPQFLFLPKRFFETYVPRTDINTGYNYQYRPEFTRNLISATFGYNWRSGERFSYTLNPVQLSIIKLSNIVDDFYDKLENPFLRNAYRNYFDIGAGGSIYFNTLGSSIDPGISRERTSFYLRWIYDISGNMLSIFNSKMSIDATGSKMIWNTPYAQYIRSDLYLVRTWRLNRGSSLATRLNIGIGYAYGNSSAMPFEKLFYAGGSNSMRGWTARTLGPGSMPINTTFSIPNQTGDLKLELNAEYRFRMFWKFEGALFGDVGNVWTLKSETITDRAGQFRLDDFYKSIAANWGVGLRLDMSFVIFRLDMGMIVRDPYRMQWLGPSKWLRRDNFAIQFGINYPF